MLGHARLRLKIVVTLAINNYVMAKETFLSDEALTLQHRSAFSTFLEKGLEEVLKFYPESYDFVKANSNLSLKQVTKIFQEKLELQNETLMPLEVR